MTIRCAGYLLLGMAVSLVATGCGPILIKPKGRIFDNGAPIQTKTGETLVVVFHALKDGSDVPVDSFIAHLQADNAFECRGRMGSGILQGKYRISVEVMDRSGDRDRLEGAFSASNSPIVRNLTGEEGEIIIDLANPES